MTLFQIKVNKPFTLMEVRQLVNSMWILDDFTPNNGATRVVSSSLLDFQTVRELIDDPSATHPEEISLCALAGSVAVFNGSIWHSCTQNNSLQKR